MKNKLTKNGKEVIPVFFASDNNYVPCLGVAINSLLTHASKDYFYSIHVLTDGIEEDSKKLLQKHLTINSEIVYDNVNGKIKDIKKELDNTLRDYYTASIFYRIFIASLYPEYDRAIYLDCDITVIGDISKMYEIDLKDNILGVVTDDVVAGLEQFRTYAKEAVGIYYERYFNSGVLLMNLKKYREEKIEERFIKMLKQYEFETICPDQDYLNVLCKDKVFYIPRGWDRMSTDEDYDGEVYIIHYNNFRKPWYYDDVPYARYFWQEAKKTLFYETFLNIKNNFTKEMAEAHLIGADKLVKQAVKITNSDKNFKKVLFNN